MKKADPHPTSKGLGSEDLGGALESEFPKVPHLF